MPIIGIAAVGGFLRGWEAAPVLVQGDNLLQPLLLLASGAVGAVLAALAALAGVAAIALIAFASRHYRTR